MDGGVWERVSSSFAQHSREDAWKAHNACKFADQLDQLYCMQAYDTGLVWGQMGNRWVGQGAGDRGECGEPVGGQGDKGTRGIGGGTGE